MHSAPPSPLQNPKDFVPEFSLRLEKRNRIPALPQETKREPALFRSKIQWLGAATSAVVHRGRGWWVSYQPAAQLRLDEAKLRRVYAPSAFAAVW